MPAPVDGEIFSLLYIFGDDRIYLAADVHHIIVFWNTETGYIEFFMHIITFVDILMVVTFAALAGILVKIIFLFYGMRLNRI